MIDPHRVQTLASALKSALDSVIVEWPDVTIVEVCAVLGTAAGLVVAGALPHASAEVDEAHLDVMARSYRSALLEVLVAARDAREAVAH